MLVEGHYGCHYYYYYYYYYYYASDLRLKVVSLWRSLFRVSSMSIMSSSDWS